MTAEPQTGYPEGWQQPTPSFSGYAGDAPSGLQYAPPPPPPAPPSFAGYAGPAPSGLTYGDPAPAHPQPPAYAPPYEQQPAYAPPHEQPAYAPPPQAAYPLPPQAAYPDPNLGLQPDELPGYLKPYPPATGFSGRGPSIGPVIGFTIFFGVFGMFSAMRRAKRAEAAGDSPGKYWMAWGITFALGWVVSVVATLALLAFGVFAFATSSDTVTTSTRTQPITAAELSRAMVDQGTYVGRNGQNSDIRSASCTSTSVDTAGAGDYRCAVTLADTTKATLLIHADAAGWRIVGKTK